jgi:hypothetical protein
MKNKKVCLEEKNRKTPSKKEKVGGEIPCMPKPEEQEGMPQHQHCPPAKHREDKNPKYHEEQQKDDT